MRYQPQGLVRLAQNPLRRGLVALMPLSAATYRDAADGSAWTATGPVTTGAAPRGLGLRVKGATASYVSKTLPSGLTASTSQPLTLRYRLFLNSASTTAALLSWGSTAQDGAPRFYARVVSGAISTYFSGSYHGGGSVVAGREYIVTHTFDGASHIWYLDGVLVNVAPTLWSGNAASFYIGIGFDGPNAGTDFLISDFAVWNRALSAAEVAGDAQNPWALFAEPYEDDEIVISAAPTGLTLTPTSAALSLAGYAPGIGQALTLSPSGASLTYAGAAPSIVQPLTLSPAGSSLLVAGYAPSITQSSALSPLGALLALTGYAPQVGQAVTLSPSPASLGLTGYAPLVAQVMPVTLNPDGAVLALTGYAPMLMQGVPQQQQAGGISGGGGSVREVRAYADLLDKANKPSRKQRKERRRVLEAEALELLPDLPEAEKLAPVVARMVYEQEARFMASTPNNRTPNTLESVQKFDYRQALQDFVQKLLADAQIQAENDAEEELIEMLLLGA